MTVQTTTKPSTCDSEWWLWAVSPARGHVGEDDAVGEEGSPVGKWMLVVPRQAVDEVWATVAHLTEMDLLGIAAKVSTAMQAPEQVGLHPNVQLREDNPLTHVVLSYAADWRDTAELRRMVEVLRANGVVGPRAYISFKRDAETYHDVYEATSDLGSEGTPPNPCVWTAEPAPPGPPVRLYTKWLGGRTYLDGSNDAEVVRQIEERWPS